MLLFCSQWVKAASGVWRGLNFGRVVVEGGKLGVPAVLAFCLSVTSRRACTATRSPASPPGGDLLIGCDKRPWGDALGELAFHVILLSWFLRHAGAGSQASRASSFFDTIEGGIHQCPTVHTDFQAQSYSQSSIREFKQLLLLNGRLVNLLYTPGPIAWCMYWCSPRADLKPPSERLTEQINPRKSHTFLKLYWPNASLYNYPSYIVCLCSNAECLNHYRRSQYQGVHRVIRMPNPSTQSAHDPVTPAMLYPLGGIKVFLGMLGRLKIRGLATHPEPPLAFPNTADFLPRLVMMAIPSIQNPLRT
jgi:hypothetical protein